MCGSEQGLNTQTSHTPPPQAPVVEKRTKGRKATSSSDTQRVSTRLEWSARDKRTPSLANVTDLTADLAASVRNGSEYFFKIRDKVAVTDRQLWMHINDRADEVLSIEHVGMLLPGPKSLNQFYEFVAKHEQMSASTQVGAGSQQSPSPQADRKLFLARNGSGRGKRRSSPTLRRYTSKQT